MLPFPACQARRVQLLYTERLAPPWSWWLLAAGAAASVGWVLWVAAGPVAAAVSGAATALGLGAALVLAGRTQLRVLTGESGPVLWAGPARLDLRAVTRASALGRDQARALRGPEFNPLAYHLLRGWRAGAVRLDLADPADPTPYWFLSTAAPELVVAAVARARGTS